jgi:hypothetical protein
MKKERLEGYIHAGDLRTFLEIWFEITVASDSCSTELTESDIAAIDEGGHKGVGGHAL